MKFNIILFVSVLLLSGCSEIVFPLNEPALAVEGWIEDDGHPIVIVTSSVTVSQEYQDWDTLRDHMIRWARVTVSDGEQSVVLTGKYSNKHFPPYIYTTARLRGEAGKTYSLMVEYENYVETAVTTIPQPIPFEYIKVVSKDDGYGIVAGFKDNAQTKDYYRMFTMVEKVDSTYKPSFMGLVDDAVLTDGVSELSVYSAFVSDFGAVQRSPMSFLENDVVRLRFSTMEEVIFDYWTDYDDVTSLSSNPFFPVNKKIRSNVSSGMGYWAGYGSTYHKVSIADSIALGRVWPAAD